MYFMLPSMKIKLDNKVNLLKTLSRYFTSRSTLALKTFLKKCHFEYTIS